MTLATDLTPRSAAYHFGPGRDADHYLYRCYDDAGTLLYIGCTSNVKRRMSAHRAGKQAASRWLAVTMTRYEVEGPIRGRDAARRAEHAAIQTEQPLFNFQCRNGIGIAAWMTRRPIAVYLVERGHLDLALATVCTCWGETREAGCRDEWCYAHEAAEVAGITNLPVSAA